jgi:hypothetical protein
MLKDLYSKLKLNKNLKLAVSCYCVSRHYNDTIGWLVYDSRVQILRKIAYNQFYCACVELRDI